MPCSAVGTLRTQIYSLLPLTTRPPVRNPNLSWTTDNPLVEEDKTEIGGETGNYKYMEEFSTNGRLGDSPLAAAFSCGLQVRPQHSELQTLALDIR